MVQSRSRLRIRPCRGSWRSQKNLLIPYLFVCFLLFFFGSLLQLDLSQYIKPTAPPGSKQNNAIRARQPDFYSRATGDRSGGAIHDMLMADAYAFAHNQTYGGACWRRSLRAPRNHWATLKLIRDLGLQDVLRYACPPPHHAKHQNQSSSRVLDRSTFRKYDSTFMTMEWRDAVRAKITKTTAHQQQQKRKEKDGVFRIVAHIRRGDVSPCRYPDRYSPNSLYLALIEQYLPHNQSTATSATTTPNVEVTIFSESDTTCGESLDVFSQRNYTLRLDHEVELADIWLSMMEADVLIMSKSRFSLVPALLNPHTVVFQPFTYRRLPEWHDIDADLLRKSKQETKALRQQECCDARHYSHRKELRKQFFLDLRSRWNAMWKLRGRRSWVNV